MLQTWNVISDGQQLKSLPSFPASLYHYLEPLDSHLDKRLRSPSRIGEEFIKRFRRLPLRGSLLPGFFPHYVVALADHPEYHPLTAQDLRLWLSAWHVSAICMLDLTESSGRKPCKTGVVLVLNPIHFLLNFGHSLVPQNSCFLHFVKI